MFPHGQHSLPSLCESVEGSMYVIQRSQASHCLRAGGVRSHAMLHEIVNALCEMVLELRADFVRCPSRTTGERHPPFEQTASHQPLCGSASRMPVTVSANRRHCSASERSAFRPV